MTYRGQGVRAGLGVAVGIKLIALFWFLIGTTMAPSTAPGGPRAASAADVPAASREKGASAELEPEGAAAKPMIIPGDRPSEAFAEQRRSMNELLEALRRRTAELAKREAEVEQREAALKSAEAGIDQKIAHLESLAKQATETKTEGGPGAESPGAEATPGASMEELGKIYGAMKAEESAPLLDRLDNETVKAIFAHMKQKQISSVLPLMDRDKAVELTRLLSGKKSRR